MAKRPVFVPGNNPTELVKEIEVEFDWHPGFAIQQKEKSIRSLHQAAQQAGINPVLEISTKSPLALGKELSAFNLVYRAKEDGMFVECAFQGSKVFEYGGPFIDIYAFSGHDAKKDERIRHSGNLVGFDFLGEKWALEPKTAFYDWIYINALHQNPAHAEQITQFGGFSDIEFNPEKSFNCQARSAALYVALKNLNLLAKALRDKDSYLQIISPEIYKKPLRQSKLPGF
jgi:hypothetical protein